MVPEKTERFVDDGPGEPCLQRAFPSVLKGMYAGEDSDESLLQHVVQVLPVADVAQAHLRQIIGIRAIELVHGTVITLGEKV